MFKDMTDEGLDQAIKSLQALLYVAGATGLHVFKIAKDLDIAVAVKRQRIRQGAWTI
jgi:hypothetical protein